MGEREAVESMHPYSAAGLVLEFTQIPVNDESWPVILPAAGGRRGHTRNLGLHRGELGGEELLHGRERGQAASSMDRIEARGRSRQVAAHGAAWRVDGRRSGSDGRFRFVRATYGRSLGGWAVEARAGGAPPSTDPAEEVHTRAR
jgi:hypothetical protein